MAAAVASSFPTPVAKAPPGQPDIQYAPDYAKYQARAARRVQTENLPNSVPEGFPDQLEGYMVWEGETIAQTYDWTYVLNEDQLAEIDEAVKQFKGMSVSSDRLFTPQFQVGITMLISHHTSVEPAPTIHHQRHFPPPQIAQGAPTAIS